MECHRFYELIKFTGPPAKFQEFRIFYNIDEEFSMVAVVVVGPDCQGYNVFQ